MKNNLRVKTSSLSLITLALLVAIGCDEGGKKPEVAVPGAGNKKDAGQPSPENPPAEPAPGDQGSAPQPVDPTTAYVCKLDKDVIASVKIKEDADKSKKKVAVLVMQDHAAFDSSLLSKERNDTLAFLRPANTNVNDPKIVGSVEMIAEENSALGENAPKLAGRWKAAKFVPKNENGDAGAGITLSDVTQKRAKSQTPPKQAEPQNIKELSLELSAKDAVRTLKLQMIIVGDDKAEYVCNLETQNLTLSEEKTDKDVTHLSLSEAVVGKYAKVAAAPAATPVAQPASKPAGNGKGDEKKPEEKPEETK